MDENEIFTTPDAQCVATKYYRIVPPSGCYFNFPTSDVPSAEHVRKSLSNEPTTLPKTGYSKLPAYQLFNNMPTLPANLRMEGRRFIDMLQRPMYGGTTKTRYLARALLEEFMVVEGEAMSSAASKTDNLTPQIVDFVVKKYEGIISDFYQRVPMFLQDLLSYVASRADSIQGIKQAQQLFQNYVQINIVDAEQEIISKIVEMIEPNDQLLIIACSHLLLQALIKAADKFHKKGAEFSVVLTQVNDPAAQQILYLNGLNVTVQLPNHLPYLLTNVNKAFSGCFEVSANGDVLARAGALQLAILLHNRRIPLYFAAEAFKLSHRILANQFRENAAFDSDKVEFIYDVVNHKLITGIICQLGCFSCDSLRVLPCCQGRPDRQIDLQGMRHEYSSKILHQLNDESASCSGKE